MNPGNEQSKWDSIYRDAEHGSLKAAAVLEHNIHLLPASGQALDLACGRGGNALLLASTGLQTMAWDISPVVLEKLAEEAAARGIALEVEARDVSALPPAAQSFDVIVVSRFLDRGLVAAIKQALRTNGLIFYQTFIMDSAHDSGPRNPAYRLQQNELLELFRDLRILHYRDEGTVGECSRGTRNEAMLVAQKI